MTDSEILTPKEIHAFGIQVVFKQLAEDGWNISSADPDADLASEPQIVASKDGDLAFFIVRTALYPSRGRFEEGQQAYETLVRHAREHGADCFYASVGIANSQATTEEEKGVARRDVGYNVEFDGLVKMELPESAAS
jgi:hypothetical protein